MLELSFQTSPAFSSICSTGRRAAQSQQRSYCSCVPHLGMLPKVTVINFCIPNRGAKEATTTNNPCVLLDALFKVTQWFGSDSADTGPDDMCQAICLDICLGSLCLANDCHADAGREHGVNITLVSRNCACMRRIGARRAYNSGHRHMQHCVYNCTLNKMCDTLTL